MSTIDVLAAAVLVYVGARLVEATRESFRRRDEVATLLTGLRLRHFALSLPLLAAVLATSLLLVQLPVLSFGWWSALGGEGNPVFGTTESTSGTVLEWLVPVVFLVLVAAALPLLVSREEWMFRRGAEHRSSTKNALRSVLFGLAHAVIGIPIGVALALSLGGFAFTAAYLRTYRATGSEHAALHESGRLHFAYNATIITIVAAALLAYALGAPV